MPIFEYEAKERRAGCARCAARFEVIQFSREAALSRCPSCGAPVRKVISRCHGAVAGQDASGAGAGSAVREYEKKGMWSHAAELAEKRSLETNDGALRTRALENYKKAGYSAAALDRHRPAATPTRKEKKR